MVNCPIGGRSTYFTRTCDRFGLCSAGAFGRTLGLLSVQFNWHSAPERAIDTDEPVDHQRCYCAGNSVERRALR